MLFVARQATLLQQRSRLCRLIGKRASEARGFSTARVAASIPVWDRQFLHEWFPSHPFSIFAAHVADAVHDEAQHTITLGGGAKWPGLDSSVLYVRQFYRDLWEAVLNEGRQKPQGQLCGAVLNGSPGVSKTGFSHYALWRAVRAGRRVVYDADYYGHAVIADGRAYKVSGCSSEALAGLTSIRSPETLYICDNKPPVAHSCFTLLVSESKAPIFSRFWDSPGTRRMHLPPLQRHETLELRRLAFEGGTSCDVASVEQRIEKWGPSSARNILGMAWSDRWQQMLEGAMTYSDTTIRKLQRALLHGNNIAYECAAADEAYHHLLDLVPEGVLPGSTLQPCDEGFYLFHHAQLSSPYVAGLFAGAMLAKDKNGKNRGSSKSEPFEAFKKSLEQEVPLAAATFSGELYERTVAEVLAKRARSRW